MTTEIVPSEGNPFLKQAEPIGDGALLSSRATAEVQAALVIAKKFPRNQAEAYANIMESCKRKGLAEEAIYSYPKGGVQVEGPSIRLAEEMARQWGNIECGVNELERADDQSRMLAYAWDLQTNTRFSKVFTVTHERTKGSGKDRVVTKLDDERDVYEKAANHGARRVRACILAVIPKDVQDAAVAQCNTTMQGSYKEPLTARLKNMASAFRQFGVTVEMIESRLGHKLDATNESEFRSLSKIFVSLRDNMSAREDWFKVGGETEVREPALAKAPKKAKAEPEPVKLATSEIKLPHKPPTLVEEPLDPGPDPRAEGELLM